MRFTTSFVTLFSIVATSTPIVADDNATIKRIDVGDLNRTVELIGRLGHPLGTMLTIDGTWGYPDQSGGPTKEYSLEFAIHSVNGKRLARTLTLKTGSVHVIDKSGSSLIPPHNRHAELDGVSWSLRAFETGQYTVMPDEYWRYRGPVAMSPQPAFASSIVGYMAPNGG